MSLLVKGVTSFIELADTPVAYAGQAQRIAAVNLAEDALEFRPHSKFTTTKVFDGDTAVPPTIYFTPFGMIPYHDFSEEGKGVYEYGAIVVGDHMYVFGGQSPGGPSEYTNLHYRYNFNTGLWEKRASLPVNGHTDYFCPVVGYRGGKIYWACAYNGPNYYKKILEYDPVPNTWMAIGDWPAIGDFDELWMLAASDAIYLHQSDSSFGQRFDKLDYATHVWTALTNMGQRSKVAGLISDQIYAVGIDGHTYKYDKVGNTWADQAQNCPLGAAFNVGACYDETQSAVWVRSATIGAAIHYKYTPAGGWVAQFTAARHSYPWDWLLVRTNDRFMYALWGYGHVIGGQNEKVASGAIQRYEPASVWELLTQAFNEGDLLIMNQPGKVPVNVEKDGILKFISQGMETVYIVETGNYYFTLSKDFSLRGVEIWRSVWG